VTGTQKLAFIAYHQGQKDAAERIQATIESGDLAGESAEAILEDLHDRLVDIQEYSWKRLREKAGWTG